MQIDPEIAGQAQFILAREFYQLEQVLPDIRENPPIKLLINNQFETLRISH